MGFRVVLALLVGAGLAGCGDFRITPSTGTGAADVGATQGLGVGPLTEGPYGSVLGFNSLGRNGR